MRVLLATGMAAVVALIACGGCSSTKMPSLPTFGMKGKSKPKSSELTNAPPGPDLGPSSGTAPNVSMPPSSTAWSNLPVYPGTSYQQTPYPEPAYGAPPAYSTAAATNASPYAAMPQASSVGPTNPYNAYPATGQAPSYAGKPIPTYGPQQAANYAAQPAAPYAQTASGAYGTQQQPYATTPPSSYAQQPASPSTAAPPYSAPQDPYGATSEPYNAANPYGSYTR